MDTADRVVDALIHDGLLDPTRADRSREVVAHALRAPHDPAASAGLPKLVEVVGYLGGALVLAAGSLFAWQEWTDLGFATQVGLLVVATAALAVAGALVARAPGDARRRLAGSLLTGCAVAASSLVGLVVDHAAGPGYPGITWPVVLGAAVGAAVAAVGLRLAPTALGVLALLAALLTLVGDLAGSASGDGGDVVGLAFLGLGAVWLVLTERGVLGERAVPRALGAATVLLGAQLPVLDGTAPLGYAATAVVVAAGVAAYLHLRSWPYLAAAVLGVTLVVPEAVTDWTDDSLGAVGGVLLAGITLLLASAGGYRIRYPRGV